MSQPAAADPLPGRLVSLRLALFYAALFLFIGINLPFWPFWLTAQGLGPAEIGALMAAALWIRVVANPLLARLADRRGETRRPLALLLLLAVAGYGLFTLTEGFWQIFAVTLLASAAMSAVMPLGDSLTMHAALRRRVDYGRVRLWGSLAFIAAASGGGLVFAGRAPGLVLDGLIVALALTFAAALLLPDWRRPPPPPGGRPPPQHPTPPLRGLVAGPTQVEATHSVLYAFGTLHWQAAGYTKGSIGWLWAEGVVAEILLFAAGSALLKRIDGPRLLAVAGAAAALRWVVLGLTTSLPVLAAVQVLHGLSFGAHHAAAVDLIARPAPPRRAAPPPTHY